MPLFYTIKKFILDLLFPIACLGCGSEDIWLCPDCFNKIIINQNLTCPLCQEKTNGAVCANCKKKTYLDGLLMATKYENPIIQLLIHTLKYKYIADLSLSLGKLLTNFLDKFDNNYNPSIIKNPQTIIITSVPLHKKRLLERGFNQAELLASLVAKKFQLEFHPHLLKRKRYTESQAKLTKKGRQQNIQNAFKTYKSLDLSNKNVIIIDDVATTLATLDECAKVLKQTNCQQVWGLVIARGGL
jgi:ComF family protein